LKGINDMTAVTIRKLPDDVHEALRLRAKSNRRSTEAEIRDILQKAIAQPKAKGFGTELYEMAQRYGGFDLDIPPRTDAARYVDFGDDNS
jgi:antitoxin FitA